MGRRWDSGGSKGSRQSGRRYPGSGELPSKDVISSKRVIWAHPHGEWRFVSHPQSCMGRERGGGAVIPHASGHWLKSLVT